MSVLVQLDFFKTKEQCEIDTLRIELQAVKVSSDKVRKKLFAENGKLVKATVELRDRLDILERNICQGKNEST
jgi:hypothetical protein